MNHLEEIHYRAIEANGHLTQALTTLHSQVRATETLQALHEVIAAIDSIYLILAGEDG